MGKPFRSPENRTKQLRDPDDYVDRGHDSMLQMEDERAFEV